MQMINLNVYLLHKKGLLNPDPVHFIDSTELAVDRQHFLVKMNIRIYDDIDCDCGKCRNKRDKSIYVVGYRMYALAAINLD